MTSSRATSWITEQTNEAQRVAAAVQEMAPQLTDVALRLAEVLDEGGRVFFFGNGGSAADAQHWATELSGRFYQDRPPLPALALTTNSSQVTALANDYGYENVFARALAGLSEAGDAAVGISTSGRSANVLRALDVARERDLWTLGFTGASGGDMGSRCDALLRIPSDDTARIQEGHELCAHLICSIVERTLFGENKSASAE